MTGNPYHDHLEERILGSDAMELVVLLYQELVASIRRARRCVASHDIHGRSAAVSKALEILGELAASVERGAGGELGTNLLRLYSFLASRLQEGNFLQADGPFQECEQVASTLLDGWTVIARQPAGARPAALSGQEGGVLRCFSVCG